MKRWMTALVSITAVAGVTALALFLAGAFDDIADDGDGDGASIAPVCAPGFPDCDDTPVQDDETGEAFDGDGPTSASFCAPPPGFPDYCVDTIVHGDDTGDVDGNGEGGVSIAPLCDPDFPDCEDMIVVDVDGGDALTGDDKPSGDQPPIRSDEGIDPSECNLVHNIDACDQDDLDRLGGNGLMPGGE